MNPLQRIKNWFKHTDKVILAHLIYNEEDGSILSYSPVFRIRPFFAWYDLWIGIFVDQKKRQIYLCPLPCIVIQIGYQCPT